jgi:O-antigen ligase
LLQSVMPESVHERLASSNSQARVDIWRSFGAAVREAPWLGSGFAPGPAFPRSAAAAAVDPDYRAFLAVGHPHNGALQIWSELGIFGAFLGGLVLTLVVRSIAGLPPHLFAPAFAVLAAAVSVSLVGHGLWQGWWAAVIGAAIVCLRMIRSPEEELR